MPRPTVAIDTADADPTRLAPTTNERTRQFWREAGAPLPTDAPVIMTGHQATFFHPGVLAKYHACDAIARLHNAHAAEVIVDHDWSPSDALIRTPVIENGWIVGERTTTPLGDDSHELLKQHAGTYPTTTPLATAVANAQALSIQTLHSITATDVLSTTAGRDFVSTMLNEPGACRDAYNTAAGIDKAIAPLIAHPDGSHQLPLWRITKDMHGVTTNRTTATTTNAARWLDGHPDIQLAPKALALTAVLRSAACNLFIHGTGGASYDAIMEAWLTAWLGETAATTLAPRITVTADLQLHGPNGPVTRTTARHARWHAHNAAHNPAALNDTEATRRKAELLSAIQATDDLQRRSVIFMHMHEQLQSYREKHASDLTQFRTRAERIEAGLRYAAPDVARAWPAVCYPKNALEELRATVESEITRRLTPA